MELSAIIEQGMQLARRNDRADLRSRLGHTLSRVRDPRVRVMVVGEFKQGKSLLINALVGASVCPVDDDIATSVPTSVTYGERAGAALLTLPAGASPESTTPADLVRTDVPIDQVASLVSELGNPGNVRGISSVEVTLPRKILAGGLALVDSPGVGGLDSAHTLITLAALPSAHALLLVTDASQEFTEPEMRFLRQAVRMCPDTAVVLTKTDLYPHWRDVAAINRGHLDRAGLTGTPMLCVSSTIRLLATQRGDGELNRESGFPDLVKYLRGDIVERSAEVVRRSTAHDLRSTAEHVSLSLETELTALRNPEQTPGLLIELERARERADDLRKQASKWQTTLNDGIADLIADLDYDLRDRLRRVQHEAETAIDEGDPGPIWEQLVAWFEQRVAAAVSDTFVWTDERARWLGEQVAEHFALEAVAVPAIKIDDTDDVLDPVQRIGAIDDGTLSIFQKTFVAMRGSYGGVLMVGLVTSLIGMSLLNPISLAAGALLGGKAYRDDANARLQRRQVEAKTLVRRQIDDVVFQVSKQLKDRMRLVQRATRDHFTDVADEYHRSIADSVAAAQKGAQLYEAEAQQRAREIRDELERVAWLTEVANRVDPDGASRAAGVPSASEPGGASGSTRSAGPPRASGASGRMRGVAS